MPAPGDQHRSGVINPFEEAVPRVSEYTAKEIATLQSRLEKQLGPEYISSRSGPSGQKVHYITAEKCIALANEVFGFNGWSSSIQNITIDFVDEHPQTLKISLGLSVVMRVTLRDGTYHEDIGYGHIENCKGKAAAFEKAKKEGTTDGLKRTLRNFGNVLGNCIYDKDYLGKVTKIKATPVKFDEANLHRHGDFAVKKEVVIKAEKKDEVETQGTMADFEEVDLLEDFGDFDDADLCIQGEGHPDEVSLSTSASNPSGDKGLLAASTSAPLKPPNGNMNGNGVPRPPQTPNHNQAQASRQIPPQGGPPIGQQGRPIPPPQRPGNPNLNGPNAPNGLTGPNVQNNQPNPGPQQPSGPLPPPAFFSARAVKEIPEAGLVNDVILPKAQQLFNPKADSPSIRKTPGFDHSASKPVAWESIQPARSAAAAPNNGPVPTPGAGPRPPAAGFQAGRANMVNPHLDQTRRIGTPGAGGSPLANRGQYRPPSMKRPSPGDTAGRPALAEMPPNTGVGGQVVSGVDAKRQRTS